MKYTLCWFFVFMIAIISHGQDNLTEKNLQTNLDNYNDRIQPEFTDVTIDKDFYFAGEKLWYSLRLSNGTLAVSSLSVLAYVEIRDKNDSVLIRQKIKCKFGKAYGDITIPELLPTGYYKLTAFTIWMKNGGKNSFYQRLIPIVNMDSPIIQTENDEVRAKPRSLKIDRTGPHNFLVHIPAFKGALIAFNNERVLFRRDVDKEMELPLNFENRNDHLVNLILIDPHGKVVDEQQVISENLISSVHLLLDQKAYPARSTAALSIEIRDKEGNLVGGNVSISVRPKCSILTQEPVITSSLSHQFILGKPQQPMDFKRDLFIYPPSQSTLKQVTFSSGMKVVPYQFTFNSDAEKKQILYSEMNRKIMAYYVVNSLFDTEEYYNLPFNNSFEPVEYAPLPCLEEFIREVVPQIKIRKVRGEKVLLVRNSDNPAKIYFFNGSPMILIDRFIVTTDEFLSVPLEDVDRLDIAWALNEINSLGVFSLADNGVVSITTKSKTKYSESRSELFKNLYIPLKFDLPQLNEKDKAVPLLLDPIYWNPSVNIDGRTKLMIELTDGLDELIVEVKGLTERGDYVSGQIQINVVPVDSK